MIDNNNVLNVLPIIIISKAILQVKCLHPRPSHQNPTKSKPVNGCI